jgi:hypothetical protein
MTNAPELPPEELRHSFENHNAFHNYVTMDGRLTSEGIAQSAFGIRVLAQACYVNAREHGWWDGLGRNFGELIALMHSELSEALEAYRDNDNIQEIRYEYKTDDGVQTLYAPSFLYQNEDGSSRTELGKPVGVASELADVIIRVFDACGALGIPIADAVIQKHAYNHTRPHRHGGKAC